MLLDATTVSFVILEIGRSCETDIVWIPGHFGLYRHDVVDSLAKEVLALPMEVRLSVPIDYADIK